MKTYKLRILFVAICASLAFVSCNDEDDNGNVINNTTCSDGIMNGNETGVDCGGDCTPCNTATPLDFTGDFVQEDSMGRPGVNTVFGPDDASKNSFNVTTVSNRSSFATPFQNQLAAYHTAFGATYENNILDLDIATFTAVLATTDALQVAPEGTTSYFVPGGVALTGRNLRDDVIDVSLILSFGGMTGDKFDGDNGTPELVSDNIGFGDRVVGAFPYMQGPL